MPLYWFMLQKKQYSFKFSSYMGHTPKWKYALLLFENVFLILFIIYRIQIAFRKVISYFVSFVSYWCSLWNSYYTKSTKFIHKVSQRKNRKPKWNEYINHFAWQICQRPFLNMGSISAKKLIWIQCIEK